MPELRGAGRNQKKIYEYMVELYQREQLIHPSFMFLQGLCECKNINQVKVAVDGLIKRNLIKIKAHGSYTLKNEHRRANVYILNEDLLPQEIKRHTEESEVKKQELDNLIQCVNEVDWIDERCKEVLSDWILVHKPNMNETQLFYKVEDLYNYCKDSYGEVDWNLFYEKVSRAIQGDYYQFVFKEEKEEKARVERESLHAKGLRN